MMGVFEQFPYSNFHDLNLDWILKTVKDCLLQVGISAEKETQLDDKIKATNDSVTALNVTTRFIKDELQKVQNGDYVYLYLNSIVNWIDNNLQNMVGKIVKYVAFGIDENGYFYADIPETWDFLTFDTIIDVNDQNYGHLVLEW
jgi:hypothetical protein